MSRMQAMKRDAAPPRPTQEKRRWKRRLIACMAILPWAPAYAGFETALGHVDGVAQVGSGEMVVRGWSCWTDVSTVSPQVELYVGGERDRGGIKIATAATDQPNEPDVDQVCRTQNRPHRFAIALNIAIRQQYADRTIYVYSVPAFPSGTYTLLGGSGQYTVPAAPAVADAVYYIHTDRLGSNVIMTDDKANVVAKTDYKAYGAASDNQQKNEAPGYTGHYEDPLTELTYMQQRYYDADLGRFLSVDPIAGGPGNVFNFNRYAYASNNPLKFVDPTGMLQQVPHMLDEVMVNGGDCSGCGGGFGGGGYLIPPFVSYDPGAGGRIDRPGGGGGGSHTLAPVNVKANRPADPVVPIDAVRTAQSWYCTPMAASVAGATAGGVVAGALTGMVDLRGNPYGIALGALAGGVASGVIKTASTQLSPYFGSNAGDMLSTALGSAVTDRNPAGVAINGMASYMGNVIGLEPNVAAQMVGRSIPYTAAATLGTAPAIKKGALVAGPMIGLAAGISDYSVEAGWNGYCRN